MAPPVRPRLLRIKNGVNQTCVLTAFVPAFFPLFFPPRFIGLKYNFFFISLHSVWQFLKTAAQRGIFITFCAAAWESRQLSISSHLSSISLSHSGSLMPFSSQFPPLSLSFLPIFFFPSPSPYFAMTFLLGLPAVCLIHSLRFTENNIAPQDFPHS